ncbi:transposable element Tc1 transposase [Trichonephila clavipes]|nr:transposable element Tc1 transposase [Trichonephila clavipes]
MGFRSRGPTRRPFPNARPLAERHAWARKHRDWSVDDWKGVAWVDESRFRLLNAEWRLRIWRYANEAMDPVYQVGTVHGGLIMN